MVGWVIAAILSWKANDFQIRPLLNIELNDQPSIRPTCVEGAVFARILAACGIALSHVILPDGPSQPTHPSLLLPQSLFLPPSPIKMPPPPPQSQSLVQHLFFCTVPLLAALRSDNPTGIVPIWSGTLLSALASPAAACREYLMSYRPIGYERVYLPLCEVPDTPFHIRGNVAHSVSLHQPGSDALLTVMFFHLLNMFNAAF